MTSMTETQSAMEAPKTKKVNGGLENGTGSKQAKNKAKQNPNINYNAAEIDDRLQNTMNYFGSIISEKTKAASQSVDEVNRSSKRQKVSPDLSVNVEHDEPKVEIEASSPLASLLKSSKNDSQRMEELRTKLRVKIEEKRAGRKADKLEERIKKRKLMSANQALPTAASPERERKKPKKNKKPKQNAELAEEGNGEDSDYEVEEDDDDEGSPKKRQKLDMSLDDAELQYSTFSFGAEKPVPTYLAAKKKKKTTFQLLKEAERKQEKAAEDPEYEHKLLFDAAMKRALGEKVKDDPKLLKKTLKREQKKKQKSAKEWAKRNSEVKQSMKAKQKQREQNIREHIEKKKERSAKKGRLGFEGETVRKPSTVPPNSDQKKPSKPKQADDRK